MNNRLMVGAASLMLAAAVPMYGWANDQAQDKSGQDKRGANSAADSGTAGTGASTGAGVGATSAAGMVVGPGGVRVRQKANAGIGARSESQAPGGAVNVPAK